MTEIIDTKKYRKQIIELWQNCFGDDEEYIDFFLKNCPYLCVGTFSDDMLVSMLFLLDGLIENHKVKYIYAACTLKEYRGRGLMADLIEFSKQWCSENSYDGLFLVPAVNSLYDYYDKFGFISCFEKAVFSVNKSQCIESDFTEISEEEAAEIRLRLLSDKKCFHFSQDTNLYSVREHIYCGGDIFYQKSIENETLIFVCNNQQNYFIKEFLTQKPVKKLKIGYIFKKYHIENIYIHAPIVYNNTDIGIFSTKCGMCFPLDSDFQHFVSGSKQLYAGLYLD